VSFGRDQQLSSDIQSYELRRHPPLRVVVHSSVTPPRGSPAERSFRRRSSEVRRGGGAKPPSGSSSAASGAVPRSRGDVRRRYSVSGTPVRVLPCPPAISSTGRLDMPSPSLPGRRTRALVAVHNPRRSTPRSNASASFHGPEVACLSGPSCMKEYPEHYTCDVAAF